MSGKLKIALIKASLPSYFPDKHTVWERAGSALQALCDELSVQLHCVATIPMDANDTRLVLQECQQLDVDFIVVLHGGFSMGDVARTVAASPFKCGFWSVPEPIRTGDIQLNNFVSLNMSLSIARQVRNLHDNPVQWYHGAPNSSALINRFRTTFVALQALKNLDGARIGVVGGLAMTFYNMEVSGNDLRRRLGIEVVHHDMHELTNRMDAIEENQVNNEVTLMAGAAKVDGVNMTQMNLTARAAIALRAMADEHACSALAVSDWPALQTYPGMHPGAAFTWLEENDGLPIASEGDVLGAITQLVARSLSGRCGYLLDMTEPDLDAGQLLMWHGGGGPLYLADDDGARWINHPMIGRGTEQGAVFGAIADLVFRNGAVSIFRIARDASALFQMQAVVTGRDPSGFTGCRGWLDTFEMEGQSLSLEDVVNTVMMQGLEHHFVLVPGDLSSVLIEFGSWAGMDFVEARMMKPHLDRRDFNS